MGNRGDGSNYMYMLTTVCIRKVPMARHTRLDLHARMGYTRQVDLTTEGHIGTKCGMNTWHLLSFTFGAVLTIGFCVYIILTEDDPL